MGFVTGFGGYGRVMLVGMGAASGEWDSYIPPSATANDAKQAGEMIGAGDFWVFDQTSTSSTGITATARPATRADWPTNYRPMPERHDAPGFLGWLSDLFFGRLP